MCIIAANSTFSSVLCVYQLLTVVYYVIWLRLLSSASSIACSLQTRLLSVTTVYCWSCFLFSPCDWQPEHSTTIGCFMAGMKLEAVDRKHPSMICVATIRRVSEGNLFIHFDGWSDDYDYTCQRSSPDIHPMGWCNRNGKQLQPPKGALLW